MTAFTALPQTAANVQGFLETFTVTRHNTLNCTCLRAGVEGTVTEETAQAMGRNAQSEDGSLVIQSIVAARSENVLQLLSERAARASIDRVEALLALYPEIIHIIVRSKKGEFCWFSEMPIFNQVDETRDWTMDGVDSGLETATALGERPRLGWVIFRFRSTSQLLEAVPVQKLEAVLIMASTPSERLRQINGFKLLVLSGNIYTLAVYSPSSVHYPNLNGNQIVPIIQHQPSTNAVWHTVNGASIRVFGQGGLQHVG